MKLFFGITRFLHLDDQLFSCVLIMDYSYELAGVNVYYEYIYMYRLSRSYYSIKQ